MKTPLTREQLKEGLLVQSGGDLLQISTLYESGMVTATVILYSGWKTPPPRTAVRELTPFETERLVEPSKQLLNKAEDAWGRPVHQ